MKGKGFKEEGLKDDEERPRPSGRKSRRRSKGNRGRRREEKPTSATRVAGSVGIGELESIPLGVSNVVRAFSLANAQNGPSFVLYQTVPMEAFWRGWGEANNRDSDQSGDATDTTVTDPDDVLHR